jgi:D-glycero-D-manno-heptose 1,7-bisphosphate phosphatase
MQRVRKAVFLDRDGTLIRERGYLKDPGRVELEAGAAEAVRRLNRYGFAVAVVSNQSGVARGFFTEEDVAAVHRKIEGLLAPCGARLDGVYYCPHHPEGVVEAYRQACACRKPAAGMLVRAAGELGVDLAGSYMIGDKLTDMEAARREGLCGILVRTGYGEAAWRQALGQPGSEMPDRVALDLAEAVDDVLWMERNVAVANPEIKERPEGPGNRSVKWVSLPYLQKCLAAHRGRGQGIVLADGAFDLVHAGHVRYLQEARALGGVLVVAVYDDATVRDLKGAGRPILPVEERIEILSALECVDYCTTFGTRTADRLIERVRPDVLAKGSDGAEGDVPVRDAVLRNGGEVRIVGPRKEWGTARLLARVRALQERTEENP